MQLTTKPCHGRPRRNTLAVELTGDAVEPQALVLERPHAPTSKKNGPARASRPSGITRAKSWPAADGCCADRAATLFNLVRVFFTMSIPAVSLSTLHVAGALIWLSSSQKFINLPF
jgi:hypothetical protein